MASELLTDTAIRAAKPRDKSYKLFDGGGLYLEVTPGGTRLWRFKYRFAGKERKLALGKYPETTLAKARKRRSEARDQLAEGFDPSATRRAAREASERAVTDTFEAVAREYHNKQRGTWAPSNADLFLRRLEKDVFPWLGQRSVSEITALEILECLRRVEKRGAIETAHRVQRSCGQVLRYAVVTGRAKSNPAADLRGALPPVARTHLPAITEPKALGALLRAVDGYQGEPVTRAALALAPLVFVRPGELRHAEWSEIDLAQEIWNIAPEKMKTRQPHVVPLSHQALAILRELQPLTGSGRYVFPSPRSIHRPLSENAVNAALRRMGYAQGEVTGHGFRATARTLLDEVLHERVDVIEHQLAHTVRDALGRAYNRTQFLDERRAMMQRWADYLDSLRLGGNVIPFQTRSA